jgi:hypothetical protein
LETHPPRPPGGAAQEQSPRQGGQVRGPENVADQRACSPPRGTTQPPMGCGKNFFTTPHPPLSAFLPHFVALFAPRNVSAPMPFGARRSSAPRATSEMQKRQKTLVLGPSSITTCFAEGPAGPGEEAATWPRPKAHAGLRASPPGAAERRSRPRSRGPGAGRQAPPTDRTALPAHGPPDATETSCSQRAWATKRDENATICACAGGRTSQNDGKRLSAAAGRPERRGEVPEKQLSAAGAREKPRKTHESATAMSGRTQLCPELGLCRAPKAEKKRHTADKKLYTCHEKKASNFRQKRHRGRHEKRGNGRFFPGGDWLAK